MKTIFYVSAAIILVCGPEIAGHATDMQRSPKQEAKRLESQTKLSPEVVTREATIKDDPFERLVTVTTEKAFKWKGGFTDTVRADNFLRAMLDRPTGTPNFQLYQTITYSGDWRRFDQVNVMLPSGLKTLPLTVLARDVVTCAHGPCVLQEIVGFNLSDDDIDDINTQYAANPAVTLKFRFKSNNGLDWNDDISGAEVAGLLGAINSWRAKAGLLATK